jgi:uncharacterized protein (TIGR03437 family)
VTGSVTFYDGTAILGTRAVVSGQATLITGLLASGTRSLRAYYTGDLAYAPSTSVTVVQAVDSTPASGFSEPIDHANGVSPASVAVGDFNGDLKADLVVADGFNVSVLLGNGNGTFQPPVSYYGGPSALAVAVGDFNGDGRSDLAVADYLGVSVLLGNGDGTFQSAVHHNALVNPTSLAVGDFNEDGRADLVVAGYNDTNSVVVLLGNGDGTFQTVGYRLGTTATSVSVGDFNGDGHADLAVANGDIGHSNGNSVSVLLGNGDGTFQAAVTYVAGTNPTSVAVGDFNRDGRMDLVVTSGGNNSVSVLLGNGNGTFQAAMNYPTGSGPTSVAVMDSNGDGKADLAVATSLGVSVLLGNGNGTFQAAVNYDTETRPFNLASVAVGDFNGDGKTDLATVYHFSAGGNGGGVSILLGVLVTPVSVILTSSPNPSRFGQPVMLAAAVSPSSNGRTGATGTVTFSDGVTVLGTKTLVAGQAVISAAMPASGNRSLRAYYSGDTNYGAGTSAALTQIVSVRPQNAFAASTYAAGTNPDAVAVADFNGDAKADLAVANRGGNSVSVLLGNGDGTFQAAVTYSAGNGPYSLAAGDFNGDGNTDLAVANQSSNNVSVLLGNGDGTFRAAVNYGAGDRPDSVVAGDFDGDGKIDLAVTGSTNLSLLPGNGDGSFRAPVSVFGGHISVAPGDFNGDGKTDLAWAAAIFDTVSVLLGNGNGTFYPSPSFNYLDNDHFSLAVGDFNLDGMADLAVANNSTDSVSVLLRNGDGTFQVAGKYSVGSGLSSIVIADINGDGNTDLAVATRSGVGVLLGNGDGTFQASVNYDAGNSPASIAAADFNGDSKTDLEVATLGGVTILLGTTFTNTNSASYAAGGTLAPDMIAFGAADAIAPALVVASDSPWPTNLGGVRLDITDNAGQTHPAPIYYVTTNQMAYLIPADTPPGPATAKLTTSAGVAITGSFNIDRVSPGLYSANSTGSGVAAGFWIRAAADGTQIQGYLFDPTTRSPLPVDLAADSDRVFLSLYGTGFRNASQAMASVGGVGVPVYGFAAVAAYQGEDVINIGPLPRSLAGRGEVGIAVTFDGKGANSVTVSIK